MTIMEQAGAPAGAPSSVWRDAAGPLIVWMTLTAAALALAAGFRLPIGPNYWDVYLFLDVAHRIDLGQLPHRDFFIPIGALPFYLHDLVQRVWPQAHPVLAVQYAILILAGPLALWLAGDLRRHRKACGGPVLAAAIFIPFAIFALAPFNIIDFYPSPGVDGFGIYNRQAGLMLYLLAATLAFAQSRSLKVAMVAVVFAALAFTKATAGLAALCFALAGVVTLRLRPGDFALSLIIAAAAVAGVQAATGLPGHYLGDLMGLVEDNTDSLTARLLTFISLKFDVIAALALLCAFAVWARGDALLGAVRALATPGKTLSGRIDVVLQVLAMPLVLLAGLSLAAVGYETQNTGSNEYVYLWPLVLLVARDLRPRLDEAGRVVLLVLVCAVALPSVVKVLHKAARTIAVAPGYVAVANGLSGPLSMSLAKPSHSARAEVMRRHYAEERDAWRALAIAGQTPSDIQYSEPDYQIFYVRSLAEAAQALKLHEELAGRRFASTYVLDFVDPLTAELGRTPPRYVSVANDPDRTFPVRIRERVAAELATIDAILIPRCPITPARLAIEAVARPALAGREVVALSPCWDIAVRPGL
jgi:hypothetical protein